jgi:DNA-binding NarL/FixJ family response regulator
MATKLPLAHRILLICDLPLVALGLAELLRNHADTLQLLGVSSNIEDAVHQLGKTSADIVLLDIDGDIQVSRISELIAKGPHRVLVMTSSRDVAQQDQAVVEGASGVINKREALDVLLKAIGKVVAGEFWLDRSATVRILMSVARQKTSHNPQHEKITQLTRKERMTVAEVSRDASATSRDIAARLHISEHTLRNHLSSIYAKLGVSGRMALYAFAQKYGLGSRNGLLE